MDIPTGRPLAVMTAAVCLAIGLSVAGYIFLNKFIKPPPEVITPILFKPLSGVLADRTKFVIMGETGISLTQPVSMTYSPINLHKGPAGTPEASGEMNESGQSVSIPGGYAMRLESNELCHGKVCPVALMAKSPDSQQLIDHVVLMGNMASIAVSSQLTNGNPDLIIDPNGDGKTSRLWWDEDSDMPHYTAFPKPSR